MRLKFLAALSPLFLSACVADLPDDTLPIPSPDNPASGIVPVRSTSYFEGYVDRQPVQPAPWRDRSENPASGESQ
jgi:hypothetical protein